MTDKAIDAKNLEFHTTTSEDFRKAMETDSALARRFKPVILPPMTEADIEKIAGHILAKKLGIDGGNSEELGAAAMDLAKRENFDKEGGMRSVADALEKALQKPLPPETETLACKASRAYAQRVSTRNADEMAEGFKTGVDTTPMKPLRLQVKNGFTTIF